MNDTEPIWTNVWYTNRRFDEGSIRVRSNEAEIWLEVHRSKYKVSVVVAIVASVMVPMQAIAAYVAWGDLWAIAAICLVAAGAIARGPDFSSIRFHKGTRILTATRRFTFETKTFSIDVSKDTEFEIDDCQTSVSSFVTLRTRNGNQRHSDFVHFGVSRSDSIGLKRILEEFVRQLKVACSNSRSHGL